MCQVMQLLNGTSHPVTVEAQLRLAGLKIRFRPNLARREEALAILKRHKDSHPEILGRCCIFHPFPEDYQLGT